MKTTITVIATCITACLASFAFATPPTPSELDPKVQVKTLGPSINVSDIRFATFGVLYQRDGSSRQNFYRLAYVERNGEFSILEGDAEIDGIELSSPNIPERVMTIIEASMITVMLGEQRNFTVGQEFDSQIRESNGTRPLLKLECTKRESVAGVDGYYLTVADYLRGTHEMDLVLSPDFPFPLYSREYTGGDPMQVILTDIGSYEAPVAMLGELSR